MKKLLATLLCFALIIGVFAFSGCEEAFGKLFGGASSAENEVEDIIVGNYVLFEFIGSYDNEVARARYCDKGAPYTKDDAYFAIKNDNTLSLRIMDGTSQGTWRKFNGKYLCKFNEDPAAATGENEEFEVVMEDVNHIRLGGENSASGAISMGFIFEREGTAATPSDPEGTYKLFESKKLEGGKESRVRVTDPNSIDEADDMIVVFNKDGTAKVSILGMEGTVNWTRDGATVYITTDTPGDAPSELRFEDGEYAYALTDVSTYYIKKVA